MALIYKTHRIGAKLFRRRKPKRNVLFFLFVLLLVLLASENELIPELSGRIIGGKSERSLECVGAGRALSWWRRQVKFSSHWSDPTMGGRRPIVPSYSLSVGGDA